jgi:MFS family permease
VPRLVSGNPRRDSLRLELTVAATAASRSAARARISQFDFVVLSLYWVAIAYLWNSMGGLIIPDLVASLVGEAHKGSALSILEGVGTIMAGAISDRALTPWGRRRPFIFGGTLADLVFLLGIALAGSYWVLFVFYFLLQTASNTAQGPYQGLMPDVVPEDQRGTASGYYGVANLVGTLGGTVVAGFVLAHAGRLAAVASVGSLLLLTMLATVVLIPDRVRPNQRQFGSPMAAFRTTFATPLRYPDFLWLMASRLLILMGVVGIQSFALFYLGDVFFHGNRHATISATYKMLGLIVVTAILVTWPAAWLSDRVGRKPLVFVSGAVGAAATLLLIFSRFDIIPGGLDDSLAVAFAVPRAAAQAMLVGFMLGIASGAFLSVDWAFIQDVIPASEAGLFMGFSNIATAGAGILARFIAGFLLDAFNAGPPILGMPGGYPVIFTVFFAWMVVGSLVVLKVTEGRRWQTR